MGSRKKDGSKNKNHAQDCGMLIGDQRPAILPWFLDVGWRPSFRVIRAPCPLRPAAGLLLGLVSWHELECSQAELPALNIMPRMRIVIGPHPACA
ncbi:hypothetical protein JQ543_22085 [Bradyrhizobium diazoefficiens]|nr:hypothetical protein [Bradyrhizobium diazoefficiens]MBR0850449.1 hypothetical protein [Bradyrhizobium diazoefficiens]